jgi:hypothetical protein
VDNFLLGAGQTVSRKSMKVVTRQEGCESPAGQARGKPLIVDNRGELGQRRFGLRIKLISHLVDMIFLTAGYAAHSHFSAHAEHLQPAAAFLTLHCASFG